MFSQVPVCKEIVYMREDTIGVIWAFSFCLECGKLQWAEYNVGCLSHDSSERQHYQNELFLSYLPLAKSLSRARVVTFAEQSKMPFSEDKLEKNYVD